MINFNCCSGNIACVIFVCTFAAFLIDDKIIVATDMFVRICVQDISYRDTSICINKWHQRYYYGGVSCVALSSYCEFVY